MASLPIPPLCRVEESPVVSQYVWSNFTAAPSVVWDGLLAFLPTLPATTIRTEPHRAIIRMASWSDLPDIQYCKINLSFYRDPRDPTRFLLEYHRQSGDGTSLISHKRYVQIAQMLQRQGWWAPNPQGSPLLLPAESPVESVPEPAEEEDKFDVEYLQLLMQRALHTEMFYDLQFVEALLHIAVRHPHWFDTFSLHWGQLVRKLLAPTRHVDYRRLVGAAVLLTHCPEAVPKHEIQMWVNHWRNVSPAALDQPDSHHDLLMQQPLHMFQTLGL